MLLQADCRRTFNFKFKFKVARKAQNACHFFSLKTSCTTSIEHHLGSCLTQWFDWLVCFLAVAHIVSAAGTDMAASSRVAAGPRCFLLPKSHAAPHSCDARSATSSPALCRSLLPSSSSKPLLKPSSNAIRHSLFRGQSEIFFSKGCSRSSRIQASGDAYSGNSIVWPTAELQLPYAREVEQQERPPGLVDLDPQNMLLRQRIVFLGGQVSSIALFSLH